MADMLYANDGNLAFVEYYIECRCGAPIGVCWLASWQDGENRLRLQHGENPEHSREFDTEPVTPYMMAVDEWVESIHGYGLAEPVTSV